MISISKAILVGLFAIVCLPLNVALGQSRTSGQAVVPSGYEDMDSVRFMLFHMHDAGVAFGRPYIDSLADEVQATFEGNWGGADTNQELTGKRKGIVSLGAPGVDIHYLATHVKQRVFYPSPEPLSHFGNEGYFWRYNDVNLVDSVASWHYNTYDANDVSPYAEYRKNPTFVRDTFWTRRFRKDHDSIVTFGNEGRVILGMSEDRVASRLLQTIYNKSFHDGPPDSFLVAAKKFAAILEFNIDTSAIDTNAIGLREVEKLPLLRFQILYKKGNIDDIPGWPTSPMVPFQTNGNPSDTGWFAIIDTVITKQAHRELPPTWRSKDVLESGALAHPAWDFKQLHVLLDSTHLSMMGLIGHDSMQNAGANWGGGAANQSKMTSFVHPDFLADSSIETNIDANLIEIRILSTYRATIRVRSLSFHDTISDKYFHRKLVDGVSHSCNPDGSIGGYDSLVDALFSRYSTALGNRKPRETMHNDIFEFETGAHGLLNSSMLGYLDYMGSDYGIYMHPREQDFNGENVRHYRRNRLSYDGVPPSLYENQYNFFGQEHGGVAAVFPRDYVANTYLGSSMSGWPSSSTDSMFTLVIGRSDPTNTDSLLGYKRYRDQIEGLIWPSRFLRSSATAALHHPKTKRMAMESAIQGWAQFRPEPRYDSALSKWTFNRYGSWFKRRPTTPEEISGLFYVALANGFTAFNCAQAYDLPSIFGGSPGLWGTEMRTSPSQPKRLTHDYNFGHQYTHSNQLFNWTKMDTSDCNGDLPEWYLGYSNTWRAYRKTLGRINAIYSPNNSAFAFRRLEWQNAYSLSRALNWQADNDNVSWKDSVTRREAFLKVLSTQPVDPWQRGVKGEYIELSNHDPAHLSYVEIGLFRDRLNGTLTPQGYAALIVNTRTWPDRDSADVAYYNEGMAAKDQRVPTLGDIDVRKVYMKIDPTNMHSSMQGSYYVVRDIWHPDTCWLVHKDSTFAVYLKPGDAKFLYIQKGTSIRVSPTASAGLGDFEFNNGRRVAEIMNGTRTVVTYTRDGQLYASHPAMGHAFEGYHERSSADNIATGPEVLLDDGVTGKPSVMSAQNDTSVAIVYWYQTTAFSNQGKLKVAYRKHPDSTWKYAVYDSLIFRSNSADGKNVTPVLTPINDTSWIVVAQYGGVNNYGLGLTACRFHVDPSGQPVFFPDPKTYITEDEQSMRSRFPTIASRPLEDSLWPIRLAYERDGKIFRVMLKWRPGDTLTQSSHLEVSKGLPVNCNSKHPSIGMAGVKFIFDWGWPFPTFSLPFITESITWEARIASKLVSSADTLWPVVRTSIMPWQNAEPQWGAFTVFRADSSTLQTDHWPLVSIQPFEAVFGEESSPSGSWKDHTRVMWQDVPRDGLEGRHWGAISGQDGDQWAKSFLHAGGRLPSIPQRTDSIQQWAKHAMVPKSISWITPSSTEMEVQITNGWMPQINRHHSFSNYYTFTVAAEDVDCPRIAMDVSVKTPEVWPPSTPPRFPPLKPEPPFSGTPISHLWDPTPIRTFDVSSEVFPINGGDSIAMYRVIDTIDITSLRSGLISPSDYVMLTSHILKSSDSSYLYTLDSILVTPTVTRLPGSAPDIDVEYATLKIPSSAPSDSVFIAIRMDRGEYNTLTKGVSQILSDSETLVSPKRTTRQSQKPMPSGYLKLSVQPNPFMDATLVTVRTVEGMPTVIELSDVSGRFVQRLFDGAADEAEMHLVIEGDPLAAGTYFLRVVSGGEVQTRKIQLVR